VRERLARRYALVFGVLLAVATLVADLTVDPPRTGSVDEPAARQEAVSPAPPPP
jgi:hypothetical protein